MVQSIFRLFWGRSCSASESTDTWSKEFWDSLLSLAPIIKSLKSSGKWVPSASSECHHLDSAIPPGGINTGVQTMAQNNLKEICLVQICTVLKELKGYILMLTLVDLSWEGPFLSLTTAHTLSLHLPSTRQKTMLKKSKLKNRVYNKCVCVCVFQNTGNT